MAKIHYERGRIVIFLSVLIMLYSSVGFTKEKQSPTGVSEQEHHRPGLHGSA
ncbi:MAG: hypothetical protein ABSB22_07035 [Thermodesulfobacteriota bacterium]